MTGVAPAEAQRSIGDYAVIGDCRSAALVSRDGSVDWLCLPRFDSSPVFGALLAPTIGGRFAVTVPGATVERRYLPDTNVLETTYATPSGRCRVLDAMTVGDAAEVDRVDWPERELLRVVECLEGSVEVRVECAPRADFGRSSVAIEDRGALGHWWRAGPGACAMHSDPPLVRTGSGRLASTRRLDAGERWHLSLVYAEDAPATIPPLGDAARERLAATIGWWRRWSAARTYDGPYREHVMRSALALRLLIYAPSGAIVASPTTSLPEGIGGERNWDYRYAWLRDASFVVRALLRLSADDETESFVSWLLHATRLTQPHLRVLYDVFGREPPAERELAGLPGFRGSRPVRVGNAAAQQLQLDVYGEVVDAVARWGERIQRYDRQESKVLDGIGRLITRIWDERDAGIWEVRSSPQRFTLGKVMCWVALDRLVRLHDDGLIDVSVDAFRRAADEIRDAVERRGFDAARNSYRRAFDGDEVDASLLRLPLLGFVDVDDARMRGTYERIERDLGLGRGLVRRYPQHSKDGVSGEESAFAVCSFWRVEYLARAGRVEEAEAAFEQVLGFANDLGLFAEEIDPGTGEALGNFPLGLTHVGVVNAACTIAEARAQRDGDRRPATVDGGGA